MAEHKYAVVFDAANNNWQVRVRQNPGGQWMWFDAGDPCATRAEAEAKMRCFEEADSD